MRAHAASRHVPPTSTARVGVRWEYGAVRPITQSSKLQNVRYDVRGPIWRRPTSSRPRATRS